MFDLSRFKKWFARDRTGRHLGEYDAPADTGSARIRETGGVDQPDAPDTHSTTGTTPSGGFVGRAGGDDPGDLDDPAPRQQGDLDDQHPR
jgi:hypothetical protein